MPETILIVDDEVTTAQLVKMVLKKEGYRVVTATNGPEALRIADDLVPDLVLLDIVLPGMDGFQVCRYLRKHARTAAIPVIMFSGLDLPTDQRKAYDAGADDYLTKPVKKADLLEKIRAIFYFRHTPDAPKSTHTHRT
jgi:two-component system cell cycle response regulator